MNGTRRLSNAVIIGFMAVCTVLSVAWRFIGPTGDAWTSVISSDGEGYYAYLEGAVVQGDLAHVRTAEHHFAKAGDGRVIKYFCGTAVLEAPLVILAHVLYLLTGLPADGRSLPYAIAIAASALLFLAFGLFRLRSFLESLSLDDAAIAIALVIICFGTGLGYYVVMTPAMSHVYAFAMVAWLLDAGLSAWRDPSPMHLTLLALAVALLALVRPTDLMAMIALPVVTIGSQRSFRTWWQEITVPTMISAIVVLFALLMVQPVLWHAQCGQFFVKPYAGEGFLWDRPMSWSLLFGARKGLFFYWPLLLFALPGLWMLWRRSRIAASSLLLALFAAAYVIGCWWIWYYGYSYGARPFIDLVPLFALPIAFFFDALPLRPKRVTTLLTAPFLLVQCFQLWQYHVGIIHPYNMDREKYRMVFLRSDDRWRGAFSGANRVEPFAPKGLQLVSESADVKDGTLWSGGLITAEAGSGPVVQLDSAHPFSPAFVLPAGKVPTGRQLHLEASLRRRALERGSSDRASFICTLRMGDEERGYQAWPLNDIPLPDDREWRTWHYAITVPPPEAGEELRCYVWLNGTGVVQLADLRVRLSVPR